MAVEIMNQVGIEGRGAGAIIKRLFLRNDDAIGSARAVPQYPDECAMPATGMIDARRDLLDAVSDFIVTNGLDVTPANMLRSLAVCSGADPVLARKVAERQVAGAPINQRWLDKESPEQVNEPHMQPAMERLFAKFESTLETLSATTMNARSAAGDYRSELSKHSQALVNLTSADDMLAQLAELAKAMLDRTLKVEEEMKLSEQEISRLRRSLARAQRDSEIDHLTGLPNRRAFEAVFEAQYREAQREIEPLCVAFCDIDHFKRVNDTHGHDTGDRVIQAIAQALAKISNDKCHVARHGGEEFVMLFRGYNLQEAKARLDAVREAMAQRNFINRTSDQPIGSITFSGGIADVFGYPDPRGALAAADQALYRAKNAGRNRIEIA